MDTTINNILVTVLMPVYNGEEYLHQAIDSILNQTFTNFEFIIINDGSTDNTLSIIQSYNDQRIKLINNPQNLKLIKSLNIGIDNAKGKYIVRMDADDVSLPNRIMEQVKFMEQNPSVGLCGTWVGDPNDEKALIKYATEHNEIKFRLLYQCHFCHPSVILRTSVLKEHKLYFDANYIHAEDYHLWVQLAKATQLANLPQKLLNHRNHPESVSNKYSEIQNNIADSIIQLQLVELGVNATPQKIILLKQLCYCEYQNSEVYLKKSENLIVELLKANNQSLCFNKTHFTNYWIEKWYNLCLYQNNKVGLNQYISAPFMNWNTFKLKRILKLLVNSF